MVTVILLCIVIAGVGLWIRGRRKGARMEVFIGALGTVAPLLYLGGGGMLLPLTPLFALGAVYWPGSAAGN
ncbi:hypothetical protein [Marinococcus luteus]|uniref:hypothetical protein n=1 Tax=Marinococcus luteus TaxID=1122204 RepID=UPI002ACCEB6E|nr:hypothetical protein [Marinococcus luteus]MDZ5782045.1 hypothetical protein [Marinococcus luteus]